jgi:hypothetical protein
MKNDLVATEHHDNVPRAVELLIKQKFDDSRVSVFGGDRFVLERVSVKTDGLAK